MKRPSQTISLLRKCRCTSGLHLEAERVRNKMNFYSRMCIGVKEEIKNGEIKTQCQDKIPHRKICYSVKISCHARKSHLQIEDLEADPSSSLLCPTLGLTGWPEGPCPFQSVRLFNANSFYVYDRGVLRINRENIPILIGLDQPSKGC